MDYIKLQNTDLEVSRLVMGCMRIVSKSYEEVEKLILCAIENGINFFDHADIYGGGQSEIIFGRVLKNNPELRKKMIIQSKCGIRPGSCFDFSYDYIMNSVDGILSRLQIDVLDILLLHRPDALMDPQEVARAFDNLHASGKVRYFGVSNQNPMQIELLKKYCKQPIIINQLQFGPAHTGMLDQGIFVNMKVNNGINRDGSVLDYCRLNDITIQAWSTIRSDLASEPFIDHPSFPKLNAVLEELALKYQVSKVAIVTAWILRHPANIQVVTGTTTTHNLIDTIQATKFKLTREEWYKIYTAEDKPLP